LYGKYSNSNYQKIAKAARMLSVIHNKKNKQSMLHIDNLLEVLKLMIKNEEQGLFFPQNEEYVCTSNMVKVIADIHNKKIHLTKLFNPILKPMVSRVNIVNKLFGSLAYDKEMSHYKQQYKKNDFKRTIKNTEVF